LGAWIRVLAANELAAGQSRTVRVGDRDLALFNDDGEFLAVDDSCPHQGASLAGGTLHEGRVICPWHSWVFDLRTGRCPRETHEPVTSYRTRRVGEMVEVLVPAD
jgi:nitrite reductase/ring-hydroxylating ferredoxin subunit